jgi:hypothetical protein
MPFANRVNPAGLCPSDKCPGWGREGFTTYGPEA